MRVRRRFLTRTPTLSRVVALAAAWAAAFAAFSSMGCQLQPIYEVNRAIVPQEPGWTLEDMTRAIQRAGARRGWDMRIVEPGVIEGRLRKPDVQAIVDIRYTPFEFNIHYKSSENLGHSGERINSTYNRWVYNLERDIRREFLRMRPTGGQLPANAAPRP